MDPLITYSKWKPTTNDCPGLGLPDRQDWLVAPVIRTRDSDVLESSNFRSALKILEEKDLDNDVEVHKFGHWGPGWLEIILVRPGSSAAHEAQLIDDRLADYCIVDNFDHSQLELEEANLVWKSCYTDRERAKYIREHWSHCSFQSMTELIEAVRGKHFPGCCASDFLIGGIR